MNEISFYFLNVGKGNCTIIDFPSKRLSIIDVDDSRSIALRQRLQMIFEKKATLTNPIDYIISNFQGRSVFRFILTHPDMDHMSGIKELFQNKHIYIWNFWDTENNKYIDPNTWENSPYNKEDWVFYQKIRNSNENPKSLTLYRYSESECCWIQDNIKILSPNIELINKAEESGDYDHSSYVIMIEHFNNKILLGGDATKFAWENIIRHYDNYLESDILLAPGHGSKNHISKEILDIIRPRLIIVSVAEGVDYDYDTYKNYGLVLSTKHYGNIKAKVKDTGEIIFNTQFQNYSNSWYILGEKSFYYGK